MRPNLVVPQHSILKHEEAVTPPLSEIDILDEHTRQDLYMRSTSKQP